MLCAIGNALGNSIRDGLEASRNRNGSGFDADIEAGIASTRARNEAELLAMSAPTLNVADGVLWAPSEPVITSPLDKNPDLLANLAVPTARYAEPQVRNVPRPAVAPARDSVVDYASATIGDFWRDGVREASYSGVDRQFSDGFDGLLASPAGAPPRAVPGQQMSDALYLAGPIPVARYDLGIASLTVNGGLNFVNAVANAGLNALGALTEPLDRYQGEITSVETGLGPMGAAVNGPLSAGARTRAEIQDSFAATFSGGRYAEIELSGDLVAYRVWHPDQAKEFGAFWSLEKPTGSLQARIDSALLPEWGKLRSNPVLRQQATQYTEALIPKGTSIYIGEVGSQGGAWVGGGSQFHSSKMAQFYPLGRSAREH